MEKHIKQIAALLLLLALAGCISPAGQPGGEGHPPGVATPPSLNSGERLRAVGSAGKDASDPGERADLKARQQLAAVISDYTKNVLSDFIKAQAGSPAPDDPLSVRFLEDVSAEVSATILRRAAPHEQWEEQDGAVYVSYRMPIALVDETLVQKTQHFLLNQNPFSQGPDQLVDSLQNLLRERERERKLAAARTRPSGPEVPSEFEPPPWLKSGRHKDYPQQRFLVAIGIGKDEQTALQNARAELAAQMADRLGRVLGALRAPENESALAQNLRALPDLDVNFRPEDLVAMREAARWLDPATGNHYLFAAVDRNAASIVMESRLEDIHKRTEGLVSSAANHLKAGNLGPSLEDYLDALALLQEMLCSQARAMATAPEGQQQHFEEIFPQPTVPGMKKEVESLLGRMELSVVSGDGQWLAPGSPPAEPFAVRLSRKEDDQPIQGLPLRLITRDEEPQLLGAGVTDSEGVARWLPKGALPGGPRGAAVIATLDLEQMAPSLNFGAMPLPTAQLHYVFRARENTRFVIMLEGGAAPQMYAALKKALEDDGFQPPADLLSHVGALASIGKASDKEILEAVSALRQEAGPARLLVVIAGSADIQLVEKPQTTQGQLYIYRSVFDLRLLAPDLPGPTNRIGAVQGTGRGAYLEDPVEASNRAITDAGNMAAEQLSGILRAKFGAPPASSALR